MLRNKELLLKDHEFSSPPRLTSLITISAGLLATWRRCSAQLYCSKSAHTMNSTHTHTYFVARDSRNTHAIPEVRTYVFCQALEIYQACNYIITFVPKILQHYILSNQGSFIVIILTSYAGDFLLRKLFDVSMVVYPNTFGRVRTLVFWHLVHFNLARQRRCHIG